MRIFNMSPYQQQEEEEERGQKKVDEDEEVYIEGEADYKEFDAVKEDE